eukprot:4515907-Pyramimonas_sp.AAC.1
MPDRAFSGHIRASAEGRAQQWRYLGGRGRFERARTWADEQSNSAQSIGQNQTVLLTMTDRAVSGHIGAGC